MKLLTISITAGIVSSVLLMSAPAAADLEIQSAQYNERKGVLFVKGKLTGVKADKVYVSNPTTYRLVAEVETKGDQFRADIAIDPARVPCTVQIQTNPVRARDPRANPGDFSIQAVRHAPEGCQ